MIIFALTLLFIYGLYVSDFLFTFYFIIDANLPGIPNLNNYFYYIFFKSFYSEYQLAYRILAYGYRSDIGLFSYFAIC